MKKFFMLFLLIMTAVHVMNTAIYSAEPENLGLPVIYINTDGREDITSKKTYIEAEMKLWNNGVAADLGRIKIKGRGNSTWYQDKKPYRIKLDAPADLLGLGESRNWILLANVYDKTHLRNALSYDLSGELGMYSIRNTHVNLVLNGKFAGLYQLTESIHIEDGRIEIFDWDKVVPDSTDLSGISGSKYDITGGYILELDEYYDEISKFTTDHDVPIMIKSPEYLCTNHEMFGYIKSYVQDFENAVYSNDGYNKLGKHYSEYIDVNSFIDYWIVNQAFKSVELLFKSCYMYKDVGGPLTFGPVWDMDWSSGNHMNLANLSAVYDSWAHSESQDREYWYRELYHNPYFIVQIQDRWWQVHSLIEESIEKIDTLSGKLESSVEADSEIWGDYSWSYERECKELKKWLLNRLEWMDKELMKRDPNILHRGIDIIKKIEITVNGAVPDTVTENGTPADYMADVIEKLEVNVSFPGNYTKICDVYVNSLKVESVDVVNGSAAFTVPSDKLIPLSEGRRNVIHVIGRGDNGITIYGENYCSLLANIVTDDGIGNFSKPEAQSGMSILIIIVITAAIAVIIAVFLFLKRKRI